MERRRTAHCADAVPLSYSGPKFTPAAAADDRHRTRIRHAAGWFYVARAAGSSAVDGISNAAGNDVAVFRTVPAEPAARYGTEDGQSGGAGPTRRTSIGLATVSSGTGIISSTSATDGVPGVPGYGHDASDERGSVPDVCGGKHPDELQRTTGPGTPCIQFVREAPAGLCMTFDTLWDDFLVLWLYTFAGSPSCH